MVCANCAGMRTKISDLSYEGRSDGILRRGVHQGHCIHKTRNGHTVSGVLSIMMEKSAQPSVGGRCMPTPLHYIFKIKIKIKIIYFPSTDTIHAFKDKYRLKIT